MNEYWWRRWLTKLVVSNITTETNGGVPLEMLMVWLVGYIKYGIRKTVVVIVGAAGRPTVIVRSFVLTEVVL